MNKVFERWLGPRARKPRMPTFGHRELEELTILWRQKEMSDQALLGEIADESITLSTMQSTLERLYRKDLVVRHKAGRSYHYQAAMTQSTIISRLLQDLAVEVSDGDMAPMISGFMDFVSEEAGDISSAELKALLLQAMEGNRDD